MTILSSSINWIQLIKESLSLNVCQSVQFSHSVMSNSSRPHGLQHTRLSCPSPSPGACSNSCPLTVMPSNHLILCRPCLLLPSIFPSITKLLEENIGRTLDDTNQSKILYDPPPRVMEIKTKVNKWELIKLISFCL